MSMIRKPKTEPPPPPRRLTPSPDGTFAPTITDATDGIWSLGPNGETQRWMDQGVGRRYCWSGGEVYTEGTDAQWYRLNAPTETWALFGPEPPIPAPSPDMSPDGTCAYEIVDFSGRDWTLGPTGE